MNNFFHPVRGLPRADPDAARTRQFPGTGTPYLPVPGLKRVDRVLVGTTELPATMTAAVVADAASMQTVTIPLGPGFLLDTEEDGAPVLLRNKCSNDGYFQEGVPVYVVGEWEDAAPVAVKK